MKNKTIYGAAINLVGVWGPLRMKWNENCKEFYDKTGNFSISKIGLNIKKECDVIEFASKNKKEVETWVNGIKCAFKRLSEFAFQGKEIKNA
jgi:hypothetical protein